MKKIRARRRKKQNTEMGLEKSYRCPDCGSKNTYEDQAFTKNAQGELVPIYYLYWCEECWLKIKGVDKQDVVDQWKARTIQNKQEKEKG